MTSGQETERVNSYNPGAHTGKNLTLTAVVIPLRLDVATTIRPWPWNRVRGPSRSLKMSPFDRASAYHFLLTFYSKYSSYLASFLRYSMWKNIATFKSRSGVIQGHWKWYHSIDCIWFPISVRRTVFEIFDFKKCAVTLKTGSWFRQGHLKCHHSIERVWLPINVP